MLHAAPTGSLPVLVVTGMAREMRLAVGHDSVVLGSGGDPLQLRRMLSARVEGGCRGVLSFGVAGGLDPALHPGDVVLSTGITAGGQFWPSHGPITGRLAARLAEGGLRPILGAIAGSDGVVADPEAKRRIYAETGAAAVDMESHVAAAYSRSRGLPFAALRVVCDPATRALPPLALKALRPDGGVDVAEILKSLARDPRQLAAMMRLAGDARAAFAALRRCRDLLGIGRGFPDLRELLGDIA